jgi:hypothetical protein
MKICPLSVLFLVRSILLSITEEEEIKGTMSQDNILKTKVGGSSNTQLSSIPNARVYISIRMYIYT